MKKTMEPDWIVQSINDNGPTASFFKRSGKTEFETTLFSMFSFRNPIFKTELTLPSKFFIISKES